MQELTEKQRRFVEAYVGEAQGNATRAAKLAGYSGKDDALAVRGAEVVRNRKVQLAIEEARASVTSEAIATREERQTFLTRTMRDEGIEPKDRIKACEVLGKMQGDFIEKHEVKHEGAAVVVRFPVRGS
jgi:phage terminase small subunit